TAFNLTGVSEEPSRVEGQAVTPSFFDVLRMRPVIGRTFTAEEGMLGGESSALVSQRLWRDAFGADPSVIGRTLVVDGVTRTIVGVMPADLGYPVQNVDVYVPLVIDPSSAPLAMFLASGIARLGPGTTAEGLQDEL